jgi:hypothetical protein
MKDKVIHEITEVISLLEGKDREMLLKFHELAASLGYTAVISPMGKKEDDWKCEYTTKKPKKTLFILRVSKKGWSVRCKLFNMAKYEEAVADCTEGVKQMLISAPSCEMHGGRCKGPVEFSLGNDMYSKCRHSVLFQDLQEEDWACVRTLIELESKYTE